MRFFQIAGILPSMAANASKHAWLRALGADDLPSEIQLPDGLYTHLRTYKHDFFAATGLYRGPAGKAILKMGRTAPLLGVPMEWLGRYLADHEFDLYDAVQDLAGVPRCLGRWGRTGFVHVFVEGHPLQRKEQVGDQFFAELSALLADIHRKSIAYVDLEKRENILVGDDGRPYLIDFQISFRWPGRGIKRDGLLRLIPEELGEFILRRLQDGDRYHLLKHYRRHRPDLLTHEERMASYRGGFFIELHRRVSRPITLLRRAILQRLTGRSRSPKQDGPEFLVSD
ncbi:MAG: hypothetical protein IT428_33345 [Planctomycetaceae bacterium]|nr:hypothetical protein [Planctomycetaceae bacterium]